MFYKMLTIVFSYHVSGSSHRSHSRSFSVYLSSHRAILRGTAGIILLSSVYPLWNSFLPRFCLLQMCSEMVFEWRW